MLFYLCLNNLNKAKMTDVLLTPFRVNEFTRLIKDTTKEAFQEYLEKLPPPITTPAERYLTKKQVMELMQVTSTAIWNYENRGLLKRCEFGGAVRYRLSDIEASLEFIKNPKK
jgi:predicted DNA-binding transcriptional regulator AlpA